MNANVAAIAAIVIGLKDNIVENGCIVNVTSSAAFEGAFATISYNASKAAIENLSKSLANNLGPYRNIRVNCVAPGWIPQSESVVEGNIVELANKCTPISQYGKAKDVAKAVLSLIDNEYANETTLKIDGGITSSYMMYLLESADLSGHETKEVMNQLIKLVDSVKSSVKRKLTNYERTKDKQSKAQTIQTVVFVCQIISTFIIPLILTKWNSMTIDQGIAILVADVSVLFLTSEFSNKFILDEYEEKRMENMRT